MTDELPIFLCHCHRDQSSAVRLVEAMERIAPAIDFIGHPAPGAKFDVTEMIDRAGFMALVWSADAARSDQVWRALVHGADVGLLIVPITVKGRGSMAPELPEVIGRNLLGLRLDCDPSPECVDQVATRLSAVAEQLASANPDAAFTWWPTPT